MQSRGWPTALGLTVTLLLCFASSALAQSPIEYVYDPLGRLIAVMDPAGDTAIYVYDPVGNLREIRRQLSTTVAILQVLPNQGPIATPVTISGVGFSDTPSQNTVTFNGTAATVTASTRTQIATSVPVGATSGPLRVETPNGSATATFTVTASEAPTITGFTPGIGAAGTAVTIDGTNFAPVPSDNALLFSGVTANVLTATPTRLTTTVPARAVTGPITVATRAGTAVSATDFLVIPPTYAQSEVVFAPQYIQIDGPPLTVTLTPQTKLAIVRFRGTVGQRLSVAFDPFVLADLSIRAPNGATVGSARSTVLTRLPRLPLDGTYEIRLAYPLGTDQTVTVWLSSDRLQQIAINHPQAVQATLRPGQLMRLTFAGTVGQVLSLAFPQWPTYLTWEIDDPRGVLFERFTGSPAIHARPLPLDGTYTVLVTQTGTNGTDRSFSLWLSTDVVGTTTIGQADGFLLEGLRRPGQIARITFAGTQGQYVSLGATDISQPSLGNVTIVDGQGVAYAGGGLGQASPWVVFNSEYRPLPRTETYTILVDPFNLEGVVERSARLWLSEDVSRATTIGTTETIPNLRPGQFARLPFTVGAGGMRVSMRLTLDVPHFYFYARILNTQNVVVPGSIGRFPGFVMPVTLAAGTYTLLVGPEQSQLTTPTITTYDVPPDVTRTIAIGDPVTTIDLTVPGQQARITFNNNRLDRNVTGRWDPNELGVVQAVLSFPPPGGTVGPSGGPGPFESLWLLPYTGDYLLVFPTSGGAIGQAGIRVCDRPPGCTP